MSDVSNFSIGLLSFNYDEKKDIFEFKRNIIIIPKNTKLPASKAIEVYPFKNSLKKEVFLKIGLTESKTSEINPAFANHVWYGKIILDSKHPLDLPVELICSYDVNGFMHLKIINPFTKNETAVTEIDIVKNSEDVIDLKLLGSKDYALLKNFLVE